MSFYLNSDKTSLLVEHSPEVFSVYDLTPGAVRRTVDKGPRPKSLAEYVAVAPADLPRQLDSVLPFTSMGLINRLANTVTMGGHKKANYIVKGPTDTESLINLK